jgi:mannose-1-phosphate guanylyltransferase/mannose-6-phosphate isomerase
MVAHDFKLIPVILAGGAGERLWPVSTQTMPKQFIVHTPDGLTLFQAAVSRACAISPSVKPIIVCAEHHERLVRAQLGVLGAISAELLVEPQGRNTAPAIALAALHLVHRHPQNLMLVLPSDQHVENNEILSQQVMAGCLAAQQGHILLFGIRPTRPATEYGYIQSGDRVNSDNNIWQVRRFVEKPPLEDAQSYVKANDCTWNSGIFLMSPETMLAQLHDAAPEVTAACQMAYAEAKVTGNSLYPSAERYGSLPSKSFDYTVLESSKSMLVSILDMGWDDLGSWYALERFHERFAKVKHTPAANQAPQILALSEERRPWGRFVAIDEGNGYKVKKLHINAGSSISLQVHQHRSEHWVVVQGVATVICGSRTFSLRSNESTYIAAGQMHQLRNDTSEELVIIEVQVGSIVSESDITRFETLTS